MNVGVLGTGVVGSTIASRLVGLGHEVKMGSREAGNEKAREWAERAGPKASEGSFADAAAFGVLVFNCTAGEHSLAALEQAGTANLAGKVLVDVANVLDFSGGRPPAVGVGTKDSLGEQIQRAFPMAKVVKTLNTVTARVMTHPLEVADGDHHVFISANDADAKSQVTDLLKSFGWIHIFDLGDLSTARGTEAYLLLWVRLYGAMNTGMINVKIMK